ncbi:hypothetical protein PACTADRAFT_80041 [Pachysolen tannophilus NRRL Y-2460]|uniref:SH3 domain-containing protein n=1 Tax=Pachysolen tannophilus NRRL Y-2460 TaxID=669874 RepID=A0A1E4TW54_PACTA|nr:hypothetical protein PACTADRAFT_80041 [Pachysolen tannophilus NRRL Y-2460]
MAASIDNAFVNNFWDKDDKAIEVMERKMQWGKKTCEELQNFYKERIQLEDEYSRRINSIAKRTIGTSEIGNLRDSFETLRIETQQISKSHSTQANALVNEVYKPLENFISSFKANRKTIEANIDKLKKYKDALANKLEHSRQKYELESGKVRSYYAQQHLLDGKELEKLASKAEKSNQLVQSYRHEYYECVKESNEIHERWIREWRLALVKFQELEEERIKFLRSNVWQYVNLISASCLSDDNSCENVRLSLEKCDAKAEIAEFTRLYGTGNEIHPAPKFIDYLNGERNHKREESNEITYANFRSDATAVQASPSSTTVKITRRPTPPQLSEKENSKITFEVRHAENIKMLNAQSHNEQESDACTFIENENTRLEPPRSEASSGISPVSVSSSAYPANSHYSDPTTVSSGNGSYKNGKHWNSPRRLRNRNSQISADFANPSNNVNMDQQHRIRNSAISLPAFSSLNNDKEGKNEFLKKHTDESAEDAMIDASFGTDRLRSALEDLKMGGNGDMNVLRQSIRGISGAPSSPHKQQKQQKQHMQQMAALQEPPHRSRSQYIASNAYANLLKDSPEQKHQSRPKSMVYDAIASNKKNTPIVHQPLARDDGLPLRGPATGKPIIRYCRARYTYKAREPEELSFKKRDIMLVLGIEEEDGWWECEVLNGDGAVGVAPSNYLVPIN